MTEHYAIKNYVRATGPIVEVQTVSWPHPGEPESEWVEFEVLPSDPTHQQIAAAKKRAIADPRFFDRCGRCEQLLPKGYMHEPGLCQGCAEAHLGVVH